MSSSDDEYEDLSNGNDDSDEDGEEDEVDNSGEIRDSDRKSAELVLKNSRVLNDAVLIREIFAHIDQTSKRMMQTINLQQECKRLTEENIMVAGLLNKHQEIGEVPAPIIDHSDEDTHLQSDRVGWSQYEEMNDGQRAMLLERSLLILSNDINKASASKVQK
jgi:hypothetical protein